MRSLYMSNRIGVAAIAVFATFLMALSFGSTAYAGVGVGVTPNFPTTVTVGANDLAATLAITNNSDGGDGNPLTLNSVKLIPSCGTISGVSCSTPDTGVFNVDASGTGSGSCAANTFTIAETNATTGEVTFTPNAPISLTPGQTCTVNFTVDVIGAPDTDATGAAGLQTLQLSNVTGTDQGQQPGSGFGSDTTTVVRVTPGIQTVPSTGGPVGTEINDTATLSGGFNPTGNVTFKLFPPSDATCALTPVFTQVDGSAPYATGPGYTSLVAGTYRWTADYAGDANNIAVSSGCQEELVVITALKGHIIVDKVTNPTGTTTSFSFDATGTGYTDFSLTDAATPNNQELNAGTYSVAEINLPANWTQGITTCVSSIQDSETPGNLELDAGETITCTFNNTFTPPPPPAGEYCSPGYWKQSQHFDSWVTYAPNQLFSSIFEPVTILGSTKGKPMPIANPTLLQVLQGKGGGVTSLARAAVGALLNASALNSSLTEAQVIAIFNAANPSGNLEAAKAQYTFPENCPLN